MDAAGCGWGVGSCNGSRTALLAPHLSLGWCRSGRNSLVSDPLHLLLPTMVYSLEAR